MGTTDTTVQTIVIPASSRDQELLAPLAARLRELGWENPIRIAPDVPRPPITELPLAIPVRWMSGNVSLDVLKALHYAARADGAATVIKLDADMWPRRIPDWWLGRCRAMTGPAMMSGYVAGSCYALPASALPAMIAAETRYTALEDVGVSRRAIAAGVGLCHVVAGSVLGWDHPAADTADLLHLGQSWPRGRTAELQRRIAGF